MAAHHRVNDGAYVLAWVRVETGGACSDGFKVTAEGQQMAVTVWLPADVCALPEDVQELIEGKRAELRRGLPEEVAG